MGVKNNINFNFYQKSVLNFKENLYLKCDNKNLLELKYRFEYNTTLLNNIHIFLIMDKDTFRSRVE